ncbi:hypothetical protein HDU98_001055 [Podochytrium sp. JEL0797]|nr:hypothetical protein HDU98_001055 [Podochytrium sp. JEL0797]
MSNIRGLGDLNNNDHDSHSDDSEDEKPQEFYTGGEKSGTAVQGPPRGHGEGGPNPADLIKDILGKAARGGHEGHSAAQKKPTYFTGSGHRLGAENEPSEAASSSAPPQAQSQVPPQEEMETVIRHLTFWQNGFTVEHGPLMTYEDPANQEILQAINSGRAPIQLLNVLPGQQVDVRVSRLQEPWSEAAAKKYAAAAAAANAPKKPAGFPAFSGAGRRLGAESDPVAASGSGSAGMPGGFPASAGGGASSSSGVAAPVVATFTVDANQPVTTLQIRLADGTRMPVKMNHTHTVGDVRRFINASRPGESSRPYAIMTTFPNKDLTDDAATLKDAGLINAVIVQRLL